MENQTKENPYLRKPPQPPTPRDTNRIRGVFVLLAIYLMFTFLWRVLIPAHEYDSRFDVYFSIVLDLLAFGAMIALKNQLSQVIPPGEAGWVLGDVLFWVAIVAGLGIFFIRFLHGEAGWWTGHLIYTLH
jgi:hypothetical protein